MTLSLSIVIFRIALGRCSYDYSCLNISVLRRQVHLCFLFVCGLSLFQGSPLMTKQTLEVQRPLKESSPAII